MKAKLKRLVSSVFELEEQSKLKIWFMSLTFFLIIGAYTLAKDLKDSVFVSIVGRSHINDAKMLSMFFLIPLILIYSRLVDRMRRYQLIYLSSLLFGVLGLIFAFFLSHPTIGIENTQASPTRLFGWLFYLFVESYTPFLVSVFWAFINSVSKPEEARKTYPLIIAGSKMGGALTAGFAWLVFKIMNNHEHAMVSDATSHTLLLTLSSLMVLCVPTVIYMLMTRVSGYYLHGYEAVYQLEKQKAREHKEAQGFVEKMREWRKSIFGGLNMFIKQPYILGIFGMSFFYEVVNAIFNYERLGIIQGGHSTISGISSVLYAQRFFVHLIGLIFTLVGTRFLLKRFGERICLLIIPIVTGTLMLYLLYSYNENTVFLVFMGLQIINYSFSQPIRESLYIPTVKELKFKSKSWIDAFGQKFSKTTGATFNKVSDYVGPNLFMSLHLGFFLGIIVAWIFTANWLGKRYNRAIANNEVINSGPHD